mgnify:CR=1 FL=1
MLERSIWPTQNKLNQLREKGEVPKIAPALSIFLVAILAAFFLPSILEQISDILRISLSSDQPIEIDSTISAVVNLIQQIALQLSFTVAGLFIFGLTLNRGFLKLSRIYPSLSKIWNIKASTPLWLIYKSLLALPIILMIFIVLFYGSILLSERFFSWYFKSGESLKDTLAVMQGEVLSPFVVLLIFLGSLSFLTSKLIFRFQNMMSRDELENELRNRDK